MHFLKMYYRYFNEFRLYFFIRSIFNNIVIFIFISQDSVDKLFSVADNIIKSFMLIFENLVLIPIIK